MSDEDLERDGIRPDVTLTPVFRVEIHREQAPLRAFRDDGTVAAFFEWMLETKTTPLFGGAAGPGFYVGYFDMADYHAIKVWLKERGYEV
jgi:hypothetical protein